MATYYSHMEEVTPISSSVIEKLVATPGITQVVAKQICYRHSRYKSKRSAPHFYVSFRQAGCVYSENANSIDELDLLIQEYI